jgi:hypothetical protein
MTATSALACGWLAGWMAGCRWHATISDDNEFSIGIGAQAQQPESRGSLRLAMDVVPLMEAGV